MAKKQSVLTGKFECLTEIRFGYIFVTWGYGCLYDSYELLHVWRLEYSLNSSRTVPLAV